MPGAIGRTAQVLSPRGGIRLGQIQTLGFYWAGFLSMILAVLKLTIAGHWSWWRVPLPVWVVLGHSAVYITVAFVWLSFTDDGTMDEESVARRDDRLYGYQPTRATGHATTTSAPRWSASGPPRSC